jgi:hypothetical protein
MGADFPVILHESALLSRTSIGFPVYDDEAAGLDSGLHLHHCLLLVSAVQYDASDSQLRHNSAIGNEGEQYFCAERIRIRRCRRG